MTGDYEQAARYCRRALSLQTELDDRFGLADTWDSLGHAEHRLGRYRQAADAYQRSRRLWQELGHRYQEADLLTRIGETERAIGDLAAARGHLAAGAGDPGPARPPRRRADAWPPRLGSIRTGGHPA